MISTTVDAISVDREIMSGVPVFTGTRVPVSALLDNLEVGVSLDEFLENFPTVKREQAVSVLDSALRQGRVEPEELVALVPRSGPYVAKVAEVVGLTDPLAQSVLESGARVLLVTADLGPVTSQVQFERVGWVDLVVCGWLVIEVDGFAVHRERYNEDRRRDAELSRLGYVVLRFTNEDVLRRPGWVLEVVRDTLRAGRPPCADQRQARER